MEQLTRRVTKVGNGAHIIAPKEWIDDEVILTRKPKQDIKKEIIKLIYPHIENIQAAFLYGSYARKEQTEKSDIDILIISDEKIKIKHKNYDIITIPKSKIPKAIKSNPILMHSILKEAKPIINNSLLKELQNQKIDKNLFKEFILSTKRIIKINQETIELDKLDGKILKSKSVIYSIFLRLRGLFIINSLLKNENYSNKLFKEWLQTKSPETDYETIHEIYQSIRDNKASTKKIALNQVEKLNLLLESETNNLNDK